MRESLQCSLQIWRGSQLRHLQVSHIWSFHCRGGLTCAFARRTFCLKHTALQPHIPVCSCQERVTFDSPALPCLTRNAFWKVTTKSRRTCTKLSGFSGQAAGWSVLVMSFFATPRWATKDDVEKQDSQSWQFLGSYIYGSHITCACVAVDKSIVTDIHLEDLECILEITSWFF